MSNLEINAQINKNISQNYNLRIEECYIDGNIRKLITLACMKIRLKINRYIVNDDIDNHFLKREFISYY